ncbi:MAG: sporulation protein YtfJ [Oscillospiraceae bacterium]|nr:sporulation protein YtfJ [Oscillospiraceae bacterium]
MSEETKVKELVAASMDKIHEMADANTVMGTPVKLDGGVTVIPVSKVVYGFAGGGSDLPTKENKEFFGGGTGAGITISPLGFLVISGGKVELLQINMKYDNTSAMVDMVPEVFSKISGLFKKDVKKSSPADTVTVKGEIKEAEESPEKAAVTADKAEEPAE